MGKWAPNNKVKAAILAALAVVIVDVVAQITDNVPDSPIVSILALFIPVVVAYLKSESNDLLTDEEVDPVGTE